METDEKIQLWTKQDLADRMRVCVRTVERMRRRKEIPEPVINTARTVRYSPLDFPHLCDRTRHLTTNGE